jgi:hypothetical protein
MVARQMPVLSDFVVSRLAMHPIRQWLSMNAIPILLIPLILNQKTQKCAK